MKELGVVYEYNEVFASQIPTDDFLFLRRYSTKNILIKISNINIIINNYRTTEANHKIFEQVLFGNLALVRKLIPDYDYRLTIGTFFASQHISELLKSILSNYRETQEEDIPYHEFALDLFKTILIFNKKYNNKLEAESNLNSFEGLFALSVLQQGYIRSTKPIVSFIKFALICRFLSINPLLKNETIDLCKKYEIGSPWNICKYLFDLCYQSDKDNLIFVLNKNSIPVNFLKDWYLCNNFLSKQKEITLNFTIIPRPLFEISEEEVVILDFDYFQYTINQGFFYRFFGYNEKPKEWNNFQSYIGKVYFEEFLCKTLLEKTFQHQNQLIYSDTKYQDFLVKTSTNDLLVIEVKMTSINPKTLEDFNFDKYRNDLIANFLSRKELQGKSKGVYQIVNQIKQLKDPSNQKEITDILNIKEVKRLNIYPIILTDDVNYNILGTNNFINEQSVNAFSEFKNDFQSIKPVLILNISTLIEFYGHFSSSKACFTDLVKSYFKEIGNQKRQYELNKSSFRYYKSMQSFDNYLQRKLKSETIIEDFDIFNNSFSEELSFIDFS
ncbi:hypothetical protein [Myroides odoratus]|uniref:hypothetical protein n=1 Tax=Myroides odoratus TaxID=256 RepID=UPI0039AEBA4B